MSDPYIGEIRAVGFNFAPRGWAFCDGALIQISLNTALFSVLGTTYGGDGKSTFGLPDLRDRAAMSFGNGPGLTPRSLGEVGGTPNVTLLESNMPPHTHIAKASGNSGTTPSPGGGVWAVTGEPRSPIPMHNTAMGTGTSMNIGALTPAGQSLPHNNLQPYVTMNFIIALQGVYPPHS